MMEPENELQTAASALRRAIDDYNSAYRGLKLGVYSSSSFDVATTRYELRAQKFNAQAKADIERTGQVSSLIAEMRQYQRDNGFWTRQLDAIINEHTKAN